MKPQYIFIHHTAVSYEKNPDQWKATDAFHKEKGWGGGGYNYEISKAGSVHQFRKDGAVTAAQYQENMNDGRAISICLDGNFDIELPTPEQKEAVAALLKEKMATFNIPEANIRTHRSVAIGPSGKPYKSCPGNLLPDNIYLFFMPKKDTAQPILQWAQEAIEWASNNGLLTALNLSVEQQWTIVVLYKYHKKFIEKT